MFQSLKGILVNFNANEIESLVVLAKFQSLKGILVNFNATLARNAAATSINVSIPERDFS